MKEFGEVLENVSLKKYTSLGIGGNAKYLIKVENKIKLIALLNYLNSRKIKFFILGNGTNTIFEDNNFDGVVIKLDNFNNISFSDNLVHVESGVSLPLLVQKCLDNGYVNLAFASNIPGSVGGATIGNAGCYNHEIMEYVKSVEVLDYEGNYKIIDKNDISFGYRYTSLKNKFIVLGVNIILEKGDVQLAQNLIEENRLKRINSQPLNEKNVGSVFRNPENASAGKLIDDLNLKGTRRGDAMISEKHANFFVNKNNASFKDYIELINITKKKVKDEYNVDLVLEPTVVIWDEI